ncbi:hypothetical protein JXVLWARM_CDS_0030 [Burkholderia phage Bm1]
MNLPRCEQRPTLFEERMEKKKIVLITNQDGTTSRYALTRWSATDGRAIVSGYPLTMLPKIGEYDRNEVLMHRLMKYVALVNEETGFETALASPELIDNHVADWFSLAAIEIESFRFNVSWLQTDEDWQRFKASWIDGAINAVTEVVVSAIRGIDLDLDSESKGD